MGSNSDALSVEEMYLHFYQHTLEKNTSSEVDFIDRLCPVFPGDKIVDIPCGYGRHALKLAQRHPDVVVRGFDISPHFIEMANQDAGKNATFDVADMRTVTLPQGIALATCLYTSFGYFADDENRAFLHRLFASLRPGGKMVIDVINPKRILPGKSVFAQHGTDSITDNVTLVTGGEYQFQRCYTIGTNSYLKNYTLMVYKAQIFEEIFKKIGGTCQVYGSFDGEAYTAHSERMIVVATAPGECVHGV